VLARYTGSMTKHLVDIDDVTLEEARAALGTTTIKHTVNEALRRTAENRPALITAALDVLASSDLEDRSKAWR
jgi:Arc/MetJ family transcription regulator